MPEANPNETAKAQLDAFIAKFSEDDQKQIRQIRAAMRKRLPTANELVWDNYQYFVIAYAGTERPSDVILSIAARPASVTLFFSQGAKLADPNGLLEGSGKQFRSIRLTSAAHLQDPRVEELIAAALAAADVPLPPTGRGKLIIRSVSAKQQPRKKPAK
ncbi:hypothetical protein F183_A15710 [Bryobacterales bacterium F-183]|nr:hypothetical protein F183_A15710 [Bryobacterales bacterium F-183]